MRTNRSSGRGALISHRSHLSVTSMIRENLGSENMNKLMASSFGHLFSIHSIKFQGQLYNLLLRSLEKSSRKRNCLSFCVSGRSLEFNSRDFALITGLKFNEWYEPPVESEIHRVVFRQKQSITLGDVIHAFKKECRDSAGKSILSLQLAFLLLLFGVLLVVGGKSNSIDITYLHLIDDIDKFNSFPWGFIAYRCLVKRTHRARDVLENIIKNGKRLAFDANGFVIALQVWAYEVVPVFARNCAAQIEGCEDLFPRMRRWTATYPYKFDLLNKLILKSSPETFVPMKPSRLEQELIRNLGVDESTHIDMFLDDEVKQESLSKRPRLILTDKSKDEDVRSGEQTCILMSPAELSLEVGNLVKVVGDLQQCLENLSKTTALTDKKEMYEMPKPTSILEKSSIPFRRTHVGDISTQSLLNRAARITSTSSSYHSGDVKIVMPSKQTLKTHKNNPCNATNIDVSSRSRRFDPNELSFKGRLRDSFENWTRESKSNAARRRLALPFVKGLIVDVDWFTPLCSRDGWLNTEHIDALLNLIIMNSRTKPHMFNPDWTIMEMLCWNALTSDNDDTLRERVGPYVSGLRPATGRLHWARAKTIYGVGNINDDHWVAYEVSLEDFRITIFIPTPNLCHGKPWKKSSS